MRYLAEKRLSQIFLIVLMLHVFQIRTVIGRNKVQFRGLKCIVIDKKFGEFQICNIKIVKREIAEINVFIKVFQKPVKDLSVVIRAHKRGYEHVKPLIDFKINLCVFFRNTKHNPVAEALSKVLGLKSFSNVNHTCPFNHDIIVDNYRFNEENLRFLPFSIGNYRVSTIWYIFDNVITNVNIDIEVKEI